MHGDKKLKERYAMMCRSYRIACFGSPPSLAEFAKRPLQEQVDFVLWLREQARDVERQLRYER